MSIFSSFKTYESSWELVKEEQMTPEFMTDYEQFAKVVEGDYGLSANIKIKGTGKCIFVPLDKNAWSKLGDTIDLLKTTVVYLKRGDANIIRIRG